MRRWIDDGVVLRGVFRRENLARSAIDAEAYATLLRHCGELRAIEDGEWLHDHLARIGLAGNTFLANLLVQMYGKCGRIADARRTFLSIARPNLFSWNLMLVAFARNGHLDEARRIFDSMRERDLVAWNSMIAAYASAGRSEEAARILRLMAIDGRKPSAVTFIGLLASIESPLLARELHSQIAECGFQSDVRIATGILGMYSRCGRIPDAKRVFDSTPGRDVVTWTAMLAAYSQNGHFGQVRDLLLKMPVSNLFAWNVAIEAYGRAGNVCDAESTYTNMPARDLVTANSMIGAYTQNGEFEQAMALFRTMGSDGLRPNRITLVSILDACRNLSDVQACHARASECGLQFDGSIANALITAYGRHGSVRMARQVFESLREHNVVSWTAIVAANAHNGRHNEAMELWRAMELQGMSPNSVSMINILSACSHAGLVDEGAGFFASMKRDRWIQPEMQHYRCLIDLLGRVGQLRRAKEVIDLMPWNPDISTWITLLNACQIHADASRATSCAARVLELGDRAPAALVTNAAMGFEPCDW